MEILETWLKSGWTILMVILGLGLIIFLHELGHFVMAKRHKVRVEVFSLGFGHAIFKFRRGETEYRIAWLPLGGYVKMAGETLTDDRKDDPGLLTSKTPWQRFQIFVAGATMNLIIAFPIAMIAFVLGMFENSNQVGNPGTAESLGGLKPGDVVIDVDGRKIDGMDKFRIEMVRRQAGTVVPVKVLRLNELGVEEEELLQITAMRSEYHQTNPTSVALGRIVEGSPLAEAGVREKDEITAINGRPVYVHRQADKILRDSGGKEVMLSVRRRGAAFDDTTFEVKVTIPQRTWHTIPLDGHISEARVSVAPGQPVTKILKAGDLIVRVGDRKIFSWRDLKEAIEVRPNETVELAVVREGNEKVFKVTTAYGEGGMGILGIEPKDSNVFAVVKEGSFYYRAGLRSGDRLVAIDGHSCKTFGGLPKENVPSIVGLREKKERTITLKVERDGGDRKIEEITLKSEPVVEGDLAAIGLETSPFGTGTLVSYQSKPFRRRPFGEAVALGWWEPVDVAVMTFEVLRKLVTGGESVKGLSGPVGILYVSYKVFDMSFGNFVWLLCLITVNLGIFNLLPIPILDGGHNVLLAIEVVRKWAGKPPPSEKFVAMFQYSGLIFILGLFVFVTYNDITRFW
jgi:regulator of sigma E protease